MPFSQSLDPVFPDHTFSSFTLATFNESGENEGHVSPQDESHSNTPKLMLSNIKLSQLPKCLPKKI